MPIEGLAEMVHRKGLIIAVDGDLPPFSSTTRKQKIHETWPSCNASTSKLSGC